MDKEQTKKLVLRLAEELNLAHEIEKNGLTQSAYQLEDGILDEKYVTKVQYINLVRFYNFITGNHQITKEDIDNMLKDAPRNFKFLRKLNNYYDNLLELLRRYGPQWVAVTYCQDRHFKDLCRFSI